MILAQLRRKSGHYKIYKLPVGAVLLPYRDGISIRDRLKLESSGTYLDEYFKLRSNEYLVVNCVSQSIYRISQEEADDLFEISNLDNHKKYISSAFGYMYLDSESLDYIIDGADAKLQKRHCGVIKALVTTSKYNKQMVKLENGAIYDLNRLYAEFDNRTIPKELKADLKLNKENSTDYIDKLIKSKLVLNMGEEISSIMNRYIDSLYDKSVLKYYNIEKPYVTGNTLVYKLADIKNFEIKVKNNRIALYNNGEPVISFTSFNKFCTTFKIMFALYRASDIYGLTPSNISLAGIQLVDEYKKSSDRLNKAIRLAYTKDKIGKDDLEFYIKALYIHRLLSTCRLNKDMFVFRGKIHRDDTLTFKSASFALPVALCHGRSVGDTAIVKCKAGTNMMLSSLTGLYQHEAEVIIDSGFKLSGVRNDKGLSFLTTVKTDDKIRSEVDNWMARISFGITYDEFLSNYVYIYGINCNTLVVKWIYNEGYDINLNFDGSNYILSLSGGRKIAREDQSDIIEILRKYVMYEIQKGMEYRSSCDLHKIIGIRAQLILLDLGFSIRIQFEDKTTILMYGDTILVRFTETDSSIRVYNEVSVMIYENEKHLVNTDLIHNSCKYALTKYRLNYLGYVNNMLKTVGICQVTKYRDKLEVVVDKRVVSIYNKDKGVELVCKNGNTLGSINFTFDIVEDTKMLVGVILDGVDRSR